MLKKINISDKHMRNMGKHYSKDKVYGDKVYGARDIKRALFRKGGGVFAAHYTGKYFKTHYVGIAA